MKKSLLVAFSFFCLSVYADGISTTKGVYSTDDKAVVDYTNLQENTLVYIYQDAAPLPLRVYQKVGNELSGSFSTDTIQLEAGVYKVRTELAGQALDSCHFTVSQRAINKNGYVVAQMTDIHVMAPELVINDGQAFDNCLSSDRKMLDKSAEIFTALVDSLIMLKPDLLLLSGDLTKDGEKQSHLYVQKQLQRLKDVGIPTLVIPGNHDIYNYKSVYFDGDKTSPAPTVTAQEFQQIYSAFGYESSLSVMDTASLSFIAEPLPNVCVIGIDANRYKENKVKALGDAEDRRVDYGCLNDNTLRWVCDRADEATMQGKQIITMMHHQLLEHFNEEARLMPSAAVPQGDSIAQVLMEHGIRVLLTGHMHISNVSKIYSPSRTDSLIEFSTGATVSYPMPYRLLTIAPALNQINMETRNIRAVKTQDSLLYYSRHELTKRMPQMMASISNMFADEIQSQLDQVREQLVDSVAQQKVLRFVIERMEATIPTDPTERAALMYTYFGDAFTIAMLTTSEGNENRKYTDSINTLIYEGMDGLEQYIKDNGDFCTSYMGSLCVGEITNKIIVGYLFEMAKKMMRGEDISEIANTMGMGSKVESVQQKFAALDLIRYSLTEDCSYCQTDNENRTNDLELTIVLPTPRKTPTSLEAIEEAADSDYYDILGRKTDRLMPNTIYINSSGKIMLR